MAFSWDDPLSWLPAAGNWAYNNPDLALAGAGSVMGGVGQAYQSMLASKQATAANRSARLAGQDININPWYQPATEEYKRQFQASLLAQLAQAGVPIDSSYARGYVAEKLAQYDNQLRENAIQNAFKQRELGQTGFAQASQNYKNVPQIAGNALSPWLQYLQSQQKQRDNTSYIYPKVGQQGQEGGMANYPPQQGYDQSGPMGGYPQGADAYSNPYISSGQTGYEQEQFSPENSFSMGEGY